MFHKLWCISVTYQEWCHGSLTGLVTAYAVASALNISSIRLNLWSMNLLYTYDESHRDDCVDKFNFNLYIYIESVDRSTGLVVRVSGYRPRGPGSDSRCCQIF
jgi:hypothetical protein